MEQQTTEKTTDSDLSEIDQRMAEQEQSRIRVADMILEETAEQDPGQESPEDPDENNEQQPEHPPEDSPQPEPSEQDPEQPTEEPEPDPDAQPDQSEEDPPEDEADQQESEPESIGLDEEFRTEIADRFPDQKFESDSDYRSAIMAELDRTSELESTVKENEEANQLLVSQFEQHPELVELINKTHEGAGFREALTSIMDPEELIAKEGDEDYEEVVRAKIERERKAKQAKQKREEHQRQLEENAKASKKIINDFKQSHDMDQNQLGNFLETVDSFVNDAIHGKVSPQLLEAVHTALNHEDELKKAKQEGRVKGRNEKIESEKKKKKGDGLPNVKSKGNEVSSDKDEDLALLENVGRQPRSFSEL